MDQAEAIKQIQLIRTTMDKATHRFLFSPWQWIEWGVFTILGCVLSMVLSNAVLITSIWILIFLIGGALEGVIWYKAAKKHGLNPFAPFHLKMWGIFGCILILPVVFTFVFLHLSQPVYIPGLWLISMCIVILTLVTLGNPREMMAMLIFGLFLLVSGLFAISILLSYSLWILLVTFGIGSIATGFILLQQHSKSQEAAR